MRVKNGVCGLPILADTEDWSTPMCFDHYEGLKQKFQLVPAVKVKLGAQ